MPVETIHESPSVVQATPKLAPPQGDHAASDGPNPRGRNHFDATDEAVCRAIVERAGSRYRGKFDAIPGKTEVLILFDDAFGSTLALPLSKLTVAEVTVHVLESNAKWAKARERAA